MPASGDVLQALGEGAAVGVGDDVERRQRRVGQPDRPRRGPSPSVVDEEA